MNQENTNRILASAPGTYTATTWQGYNVLVIRRTRGKGFEVRTNQENGWTRIDEYDENGNLVSEDYKH
ncbi:MAG: hypothetical protein ACOX6Y_08475 [Christensenellales bacterium]|jgi:hypothetical protein|nr:hypothetical protein [Bacillota bacterium]